MPGVSVNARRFGFKAKAGRVLLSGVALSALATLAACSSVPVPTEQLAVSRAAVESAERSGAPEFAAAELLRARQKLDQAQEALRKEDNERARRLAEQAEVDAQLAQARANSQRSRAAVNEVEQSIRALRTEAMRTDGSSIGGATPNVTPIPVPATPNAANPNTPNPAPTLTPLPGPMVR